MPAAPTCLLYLNRATGLVPKGLRFDGSGVLKVPLGQESVNTMVDVMADIAANIDQHRKK